MSDKKTITPAGEQDDDDLEDGEIETDDENGDGEVGNINDDDDEGDGCNTNVTSPTKQSPPPPSSTIKNSLLKSTLTPQSALASTAASIAKPIQNVIFNNLNKKEGRKSSKQSETFNNAKGSTSSTIDDDWMGNVENAIAMVLKKDGKEIPPHPKLHNSSGDTSADGANVSSASVGIGGSFVDSNTNIIDTSNNYDKLLRRSRNRKRRFPRERDREHHQQPRKVSISITKLFYGNIYIIKLDCNVYYLLAVNKSIY